MYLVTGPEDVLVLGEGGEGRRGDEGVGDEVGEAEGDQAGEVGEEGDDGLVLPDEEYFDVGDDEDEEDCESAEVAASFVLSAQINDVGLVWFLKGAFCVQSVGAQKRQTSFNRFGL